jgi:hypothetical protein
VSRWQVYVPTPWGGWTWANVTPREAAELVALGDVVRLV